MRTEGGVFPFVQPWYADSAVDGRAGYSYDIEPLFHRFERLMRKKTFTGNAGVFIECLHFLRSISLCKNGYVNTFSRVAIL